MFISCSSQHLQILLLICLFNSSLAHLVSPDLIFLPVSPLSSSMFLSFSLNLSISSLSSCHLSLRLCLSSLNLPISSLSPSLLLSHRLYLSPFFIISPSLSPHLTFSLFVCFSPVLIISPSHRISLLSRLLSIPSQLIFPLSPYPRLSPPARR